MRRLLWIAVLGAGLCMGQEATQPKGQTPEASEDPLAVWKWANFVLLVAGVGYLLSKSVPALFQARTQEIQKGIAEAQQVKQQADKRAADMEARMAKLGADIEAFRVKAKAEMEQEGQRIQEQTEVHAKKLEAQAASEIETAAKVARASLKQYAAELSLDLAAQHIRTRMNPETEAGLVDNFLADLNQQGSKN